MMYVSLAVVGVKLMQAVSGYSRELSMVQDCTGG